MAVTGSCLCGAVRYEVDPDPPAPLSCHCRFCRRAHGAPFVMVSAIPRETLRWLSGEELISEYATRGGGQRYFCSVCGTRLYNSPRSFPGLVSLVVATLDEELASGPVAHINVESKAPWFEIQDGLPRFDALPKAAKRVLETKKIPRADDPDAG